MPWGRDCDPFLPDARVAIYHENELELNFERNIQATEGGSVATAISTGFFERDGSYSIKANLDKIRDKEEDEYFSGNILRSRMLKYLVRPGTTWLHTQAHLAKTTSQIQVMNKSPCPGRARNEFTWQFHTRLGGRGS